MWYFATDDARPALAAFVGSRVSTELCRDGHPDRNCAPVELPRDKDRLRRIDVLDAVVDSARRSTLGCPPLGGPCVFAGLRLPQAFGVTTGGGLKQKPNAASVFTAVEPWGLGG